MQHSHYQFTKAAEIKTFVTETCQDRKYTDIMKAHMWEVIQEAMGPIKARMKPSWEFHYMEQSVTLRSKSKSHSIKVTMGCEVFIDIRLKNKIDFRSTKYSGRSIEDAVAAFKLAMEDYLLPVSVLH